VKTQRKFILGALSPLAIQRNEFSNAEGTAIGGVVGGIVGGLLGGSLGRWGGSFF